MKQYIISNITDRTIWNNFFEEHCSPSFLQSWEWGEFQKTLGYKVLRLGVFENKNLVGIAQVIVIKSKRGSFLFIPHGPILHRETYNVNRETSIMQTILDYNKQIAQQNHCSFIRIAPIVENTPDKKMFFRDLGFRNAPIYMHAETVWTLPLEKSEDVLLQDMRKTTRYLIRKAEKDHVVIEKRTDPKVIDDFYHLYEETAKREHFVPFSRLYVKNEFESFYKTGNAVFLFGNIVANKTFSERVSCLSERDSMESSVSEVEGESSGPTFAKGHELISQENGLCNKNCLASALIIFTKSTAFYHQGASIHSKIPVTYALQWEAIKEAKKRGCSFYNFWGIAPDENPNHPWAGLTQFKKGFGGKQIDYLPTQDLLLTPRYYLTWIYEQYLRMKRKV